MKWFARELGYGITVECGTTLDVEPVHEMEKVLFAQMSLQDLYGGGCINETIEEYKGYGT